MIERRATTTDVVFERLREEILSLTLRPGTKLSEVEVARRFGVSRQPVRDAFNRLGNLNLLLIRPQKATKVRGFSMEDVSHARFVRLSVEMEVIRRACAIWNNQRASALRQNIEQQRQAIEVGRQEDFHGLDNLFHKMICEFSGSPYALRTIQACKDKTERLCRLSLDREHEALILLEDHQRLAHALENGATDEAMAVVQLHLSRLDSVLEEIQRTHAEYFE